MRGLLRVLIQAFLFRTSLGVLAASVSSYVDSSHTIQLPVVDGKDIRFHRMSTADGLSQTRVGQIVQDDQGFMWFGTQYGLNRFDGYKFRVFAHDTRHPNSLGGVYITELYKDRSGTLWVGCDQFLDRFNRETETFTHFRLEAGDRNSATINIHNIFQDNKSGMLWLSTGQGLYRLDPATGRIKRYLHDPNDDTSVGNNDIKRTGEDGSGAFWVAHSGGMDRLDVRTGRVDLHVRLPDSGSGIIFHQDKFGVFWLIYGNDGKLGVFDPAAKTIINYSRVRDEKSRSRWNPITAMIEDQDGAMWFGTGADGLLRFERDRMRFVRYTIHSSDPESLADDRVTALCQDREGNFWVGLHQAGPNLFSKRSLLFESPTQQAGHAVETRLVSVVHEDKAGDVWMGAGSGALMRIDRTAGTISTFDYTAGTDVLSIVEQSPAIFWLGTSGMGLMRFDKRNGRVKVFKNNPSDRNSLSSNMVEKLLISRSGALWAATWGDLDLFDPIEERFHSFNPHSDFGGLNFHSIAEDKDGILWLGSNLGLYRFDPKTKNFTNFKNDLQDGQSLSDNRVNAVFFDHSGTMWVGTQNGLDRFDRAAKRFRSFYKHDGLSGNVISCILEDSQNALWMSTNEGVTSFDVQRKQFKTYGLSDGLPGLDLTGWGACSKGSTGEMFFGGFSGATAFYPTKAATSLYVPPIKLTAFRLFGETATVEKGSPLQESITYSSSITLAHWQNFFSFEFAALSFSDASTNRYRYMLEGLDNSWIQAGSDSRQANYTAVPPGKYWFRVQGATSRSKWSVPGVAFQVVVLPPWWATWWFRILCTLASALTIFFLHRVRLHQATERLSVRFEERLAERTRIARELHDTLLQSFHGLMLRFQAVQNLLPERPVDAKQSLENAIDRAADAITESRNAVQELRTCSVDGNSLVSTLRLLGEEFVVENTTSHNGQPSTAFGVLLEGAPRLLNAPIQADVYRILREAIGNAFRHAHAKQIELDIRYEARLLRLRVRDDGIGMSNDLLARGGRDGHWGLPGMRERAKAIGANLDVWSHRGRGTEIELTVPARIAYAGKEKPTPTVRSDVRR